MFIKKNKSTFIISLITILSIIFIILIVKYNINVNNNTIGQSVDTINNKLAIAVCPTYYEEINKLDHSKYTIIPTISTAESIQLLNNNQADIIISGRILKPNEPNLEKHIVSKNISFSFISDKEQTIYENNLSDYKFYTDQDINEIQSNINLNNIEKVNDVYTYLNKGIIITDWTNTDYQRSSIVHILDQHNQRLKISRRPTAYCPNNCQLAIEDIYFILNNL